MWVIGLHLEGIFFSHEPVPGYVTTQMQFGLFLSLSVLQAITHGAKGSHHSDGKVWTNFNILCSLCIHLLGHSWTSKAGFAVCLTGYSLLIAIGPLSSKAGSPLGSIFCPFRRGNIVSSRNPAIDQICCSEVQDKLRDLFPQVGPSCHMYKFPQVIL